MGFVIAGVLAIINAFVYYSAALRARMSGATAGVLAVIAAVATFLSEPILHKLLLSVARDWYVGLLASGPDFPIIVGNMFVGFGLVLGIGIVIGRRDRREAQPENKQSGQDRYCVKTPDGSKYYDSLAELRGAYERKQLEPYWLVIPSDKSKPVLLSVFLSTDRVDDERP